MGNSKQMLVALFLSLVLIGCGSSQPMLQSITVQQQPSVDFPQFTASGTYSNGTHVSPLAVSWVNTGSPVMVVARPPYALNSAPFVPQCIGGQASVVAIAPANPRAPSSGSIPQNVWIALTNGSAQSGGFVAGRAQAACQ